MQRHSQVLAQRKFSGDDAWNPSTRVLYTCGVRREHMCFSVLYARDAHLRVALAIGMLLTSWLAQSCTPHEVSAPSLLHTAADALTPAETAVPAAAQALPVVMAFTDPSAQWAIRQGVERPGRVLSRRESNPEMGRGLRSALS